ncbi:MAG: hypothetical protein Q8918_09200 [Bacteroidota bacterium]|nr:hypothetical protein [Bacteroidota bacterium]MDP4250266.1 hypothetical protein [Bacteroidota bacterium]
MKMTLILFNIAFLLLLTAAPALKRINRTRLFTMIMLLMYSAGIIKLVLLYPVPCLSSLGLGVLIVLSIAFLFRQKPARPERKDIDHRIRMLNWKQHDIAVKSGCLSALIISLLPI